MNGMLEGVREERVAYWSKLIAEQEASGTSVRCFYEQRGLGYTWRRRLQKREPNPEEACWSERPEQNHHLW
jgi:hypothetical protein